MQCDPGSYVTYFARTNKRDPFRTFGIKQKDRLSHMYIVGKTGTGKSTLLETLIGQDIWSGEGCALIDPHGDLVERVGASVPKHRRSDVIYWNVPDPKQPFGYNPLRHVGEGRQPLAASGMLEVLKMQWPEAWGVRMEHVLRNALLALLNYPNAELPDVLRLLMSKEFRKEVIRHITNAQVKAFWLREYEAYSFRYRADSIAPIQNKLGAFLANPILYRLFTDAPEKLSIRSTMDQGKVLLINLSKGHLGEDASALLGGLLVTTVGLAAYSRADTPEADRRPFWLYIDEFQTFTTLSVANILSETRKFRVGMILAHQYLHQLKEDVRHAVLGNAATLVCFRMGTEDAGILAREFEPTFERLDLLNLPNHDIYLRLMIDGTPSIPFSATTLVPSETTLHRLALGN